MALKLRVKPQAVGLGRVSSGRGGDPVAGALARAGQSISGIGRDIAPDHAATPGTQIQRKQQRFICQRLLKRLQDNPCFNRSNELRLIDIDNPVHTLQREEDPAIDRHRATG